MKSFGAEPVRRLVLDTSAYSHMRAGRAGTPVSVNDIWIAAATVDCGGHVVTFDRDFHRMKPLDYTVL